VGVMIEGKKKTVRYVICSEYAERPMVHTIDERTVPDQADDTKKQHSMRFSLNPHQSKAYRPGCRRPLQRSSRQPRQTDAY
jgi:hypothetical protein